MKKLLVVLIVFILIATAAVPLLAQTQVENFRRGDTVTLAKDETLNRDFFAFGNRVEISGTVNGDVYAAGGTVMVDGTVNGDLIAAGGTIEISGKVSQDVRVAGGNINITGKIGRSLTLGAGNATLAETATLPGSVVGGAGNLTISTPVGGDVRVGTGNLTLGALVKGNVDAASGSLRLSPKAVVGGNLSYWSNKDASIDSSAKVVGKTAHYALPAQVNNISPDRIFEARSGFFFALKIVSIIYSLIIGFLLLVFLPSFTQNVATKLLKKPWSSLGWGALFFFGIPVLIFLLFVTIIGIPAALFAIPLYLVGLFLVRIFGMVAIGQLASERFNWKLGKYWSLVLGAAVYYLLQLVPILGALITFLLLVFSIGALVQTKKDFYTAARKASLL